MAAAQLTFVVCVILIVHRSLPATKRSLAKHLRSIHRTWRIGFCLLRHFFVLFLVGTSASLARSLLPSKFCSKCLLWHFAHLHSALTGRWGGTGENKWMTYQRKWNGNKTFNKSSHTEHHSTQLVSQSELCWTALNSADRARKAQQIFIAHSYRVQNKDRTYTHTHTCTVNE